MVAPSIEQPATCTLGLLQISNLHPLYPLKFYPSHLHHYTETLSIEQPTTYTLSKWGPSGRALDWLLASRRTQSIKSQWGWSFSGDPELYWLEHGSSVTWKTLLDVLGHFETKHTVDELTAKIVSVLGGGDQVSVCCVLSEGTVWCGVWGRQVMLSYDLCLCLCWPYTPLLSQVPLQLPNPSVSTGDIEENSSERTAQLSWTPAKRRRTSDAQGTKSVFVWWSFVPSC